MARLELIRGARAGVWHVINKGTASQYYRAPSCGDILELRKYCDTKQVLEAYAHWLTGGPHEMCD